MRVNGSGFSIIQKPQIVITVGDEVFTRGKELVQLNLTKIFY